MMNMGMIIFLLLIQISLYYQIPVFNDQSFLSKDVPKSDLYLHITPIVNFDSAGFIESSDDLYQGNSDTGICIKCIFDGIFEQLDEKTPKTITLTEFSYFMKYYSLSTKEQQEKIKTLIQNGNLEFCLGGYVKVSEQMISYENILNQMTYVSRLLLREFRILPRSSCNIGTHGHSLVYNQLLGQCGYDGVFIDNVDINEAKNRKVSKDMEFFIEYKEKLSNKTIFSHINYLSNDETVFGDGFYQILWDGIEGDIIHEKMQGYVEWIYQQANFFQSNQIFHQIGGDYKFKDATSDYRILDFVIKYLNKFYEKFKIKAGYSTPYIYMNEVSKEKKEGKINIYFEKQNYDETNDFIYKNEEKFNSIGLFSNRQWMKGFLQKSWLIYDVYKTYLAVFLLTEYMNSADDIKNEILNNYEKHLNNLEKKLMISLEDKVVSGIIQEFVARKLKADIKDAFIENFESIGTKYAIQYNLNSFQENINLTFYDDQMDIENSANDYLSQGKSVLITVYNPSGDRKIIISFKVPNNEITVIDEDNNLIRSDVICESNSEDKPVCILYMTLAINQLSFSSYKILPRKSNNDDDKEKITSQAVFKGFVLKFSKLMTFSVDNDFNKFEYKVCKPREKESYSDSKKYRLDINEFIQTQQNEDSDGDNINDDDKELHICLTEKFSIDYRMFLSRECDKKQAKCSNKFDFNPNIEQNLEIVNASIYIGHEVFELKLKRNNMITKIRLYKSFPEKGLTIETAIEKVSLESNEYGREIFLVIKSLEIQNENVFYIDLNGLYPKKKFIKSYEEENYGTYSYNFYPTTSFTYIEDLYSHIRMTVLNDRTQAIGCLKEGEISFLIYRRLASYSQDKSTEDLIEKKINLIHILMFNDPNYFPPHLRQVQKEIERPLLKFAGVSLSNTFQKKKIDDVKKMDLPKDLRFSLKIFKSKEILLSLQNINESEKMKLKFGKENNNFLDKLIRRKLNIKSINEMNLSGNQFKSQSEKYKLEWAPPETNQNNMVKSFEQKQKFIKDALEVMDDDDFIQLMPLEIRVFMITFY